jgi:hypothetical protein
MTFYFFRFYYGAQDKPVRIWPDYPVCILFESDILALSADGNLISLHVSLSFPT